MPERQGRARDPLAAVAEWLATPAAERIAEQRLRERRLGIPAREVLDTALTNIWQRWRRADTAPEIDDVARYCSIVIRNVVRDIAAGFDRLDLVELDDLERLAAAETVGRAAGAAAAGRAPSAAASVGTRDDAMRAALEATSTGEPWVLSAALTYVTLSEFPDLAVDEAPWPEAGARPDQARMWPSLWLAGRRHGVFPDGGPHSPAQRQRLSRAAAKVRAAIEQAAAAVWPDRGVR